MRRLTCSICFVTIFLSLCSISCPAQEKTDAANDARPSPTSLPTKQAAQRARQEKEIEAAAFLALLTNPDTKPNPNSTKVLVLDTDHGDRTDLHFLKGFPMQGMVIHPFADIVIKEIAFSNEPRDGGMRTYLEKVSGAKAVKYSISRTRWMSDNEVEVDWFVTSYPQFGLGGTYQLFRKNGKWIGKQIKPGSMFRA